MKKSILIVLAGLFLAACEKHESNEPGQPDETQTEYTLNDDVIVFDEEMSQYIISCSNGEIILGNGIDPITVPTEGKIICAPITVNTPSGFLGRISDITENAAGYIIETAPVPLYEVFDELHIDTNMDVTGHLQSTEDINGNTCDAEMVSDTVWDSLSEAYADSLSFVATKTSGSITTEEKTAKLDIPSDSFDGYLYLKFSLSAKIDISSIRQINSFELTLSKKTGIEGEWTVFSDETEMECNLASLKHVFSPIPIPGTPVVIVPQLYSDLSLSTKENTEIVTSLNYQFENQSYTFKYLDGQVSFDTQDHSVDNDKYLRFKSLNCKTTFTFSLATGMKFSFWNENLMSLGGEFKNDLAFKFDLPVSMDDTDLLKINPEITVTPAAEISLYIESLLFKLIPENEDGRIAWKKDLKWDPFPIHAFPEFSGISVSQSDKEISISSNIQTTSLIRCEEAGFALFESGNDKAIEHNSFLRLPWTKSEKTCDIVFTKPDNNKTYTIRPYVMADGKYYYGNGGKKRVKSYFGETAGGKFSITYDNQNRIISIYSHGHNNRTTITYDDQNNTATVSDYGERSTVLFDSNGNPTKIGDESIQYDSNGHMTGSRCPNWIYSYTWDGDNISYTKSNVISSHVEYSSFSYSDYENKFNCDIWGNYNYYLPTYYILLHKGPISEKLPATRQSSFGSATFSYRFDDEGYVTAAIEHFTSSNGGGTVTYTFEYEQYFE